MRWTEDWLALLAGGVLLLAALVGAIAGDGANALADAAAAPGSWRASPLESFDGRMLGLAGVGLATLGVFAVATRLGGEPASRFVPAFVALFALATLAYVLAKQQAIAYYGFGYMLWAILLGLVIANTIGTPGWLRPACRGELMTKVGLVLLGAEVLFGRLVALGVPGIGVAWVVTPVVLVSTYLFGRHVLRIASPSLAMVVAADMSVCGVSAAIATAAACRAKKEELSLAIGMSMLFTAVMMVVLPIVVVAMGLGPIIGGAWIGGTIDSTGAVAAAGLALGDEGLQVAATIKMIQNVLVGVTAFGVAVYWVTRVEPGEGAQPGGRRPDAREVWRRFPKFILGFLGASIAFSLLSELHADGERLTAAAIDVTKTLRNWCFCLAFTAIGLDTNFRELAETLAGGKPLVLYVCGQSLNLVLTLAMAYLMFGLVFPPA